ncbi:hypothetical protein MUN74_10905 [Agromyces endophyticus]|uniref:hypothetical protein n=1 Tax=Agromyces sp. H17E-10 TaxID=2932244 RepID=UPI001FD0516B|nr:hypothetical protein [Agromyces sp. H17E-10]UOQ87812.1 hypothetical protein MUN74_10905 [Agromyces sp. H17E-10]
MTDATGSASAGAVIERVRASFAAAAASLAAAGARTEVLAELVEPKRVLGIARAPRMAQLGRVWRLGVLLVASDGSAYATGHVVRAELPARRSVLADSVAEHRAWQAAAVRGGIAEGETVDFDAAPVDLDTLGRDGVSGPLVVRDGDAFVRWNPNQPDALAELERYLADRVGLLVEPPAGA